MKLGTFLGAGAFKETFHVTDTSGNQFALKIVDPDKLHRERLKREISANTLCRSNFVATLYQSGSIKCFDQEWFYVVEEYLDGGTLTERLPISVEFSKNLMLCLLEAIKCLKDNNLVHRDIKPDNIMFRHGSVAPVLVDFGLVRDLDSSSLTQSWAMMGPGTPFFASPEQLNNEKFLITWLSDQFSLAVVIAVSLTDCHPFASSKNAQSEAVRRVVNKEGIHSWFIDFAMQNGLPYLIRMLEPWPHRRFNNIDQLMNLISGR
jgi:serine/threonine protein kinase